MGADMVRIARHLLLSQVTFMLVTCPATMAATAAEPVAASAASGSGPVPAEAGRVIYQQRGADGRVVFTDRPATDLATERRWQMDPAENPASAAERREASRVQADRVTERIQRSIDQQQARSNELQIEQLRAQQQADALAAERLRERDREYASRPYVLLPARPWNRPPSAPQSPRPPHPPGNVKPVAPPVPEISARPRATTPVAPERIR